MKKSVVFKASVVYVLVSFLNKALGIITIPVFTNILSTEEMGIVTTFIAWLSMLTPLVTLSLVTAGFFVAMNDFKDIRNEYQSSILSFTTVSTFAFFLVYLLSRNILNHMFTLPTSIMVFMFVYLMVSPALDIWLIRQRYEYNLKGMAIVTVLTNIIPTLIAVITTVFLRNSNINLGFIRIYCTYGVQILFCLFFYILIIKKGKVLYSRRYWSYAIKLSAPLVIHNIAKSILDVSDRSMISYISGKSSAGIYGTIYSVSSLALIVWNAINTAFTPYVFEKLDEHNESDATEVNLISMKLIMLYAVATIVLSIIAPEIVKLLMTDDYYTAVNIIPAIVAGIYFTCIYNLYANVILYHKKTTLIMKATLTAACTNIVLNYICINHFGYQAAAYTTLLSCVLLAIMQGLAMNKIHKEKLYDNKMIFIISVMVIVICIATNFIYSYPIIRYVILLIIGIMFVINRKKLIDIVKAVKR